MWQGIEEKALNLDSEDRFLRESIRNLIEKRVTIKWIPMNKHTSRAFLFPAVKIDLTPDFQDKYCNVALAGRAPFCTTVWKCIPTQIGM
jgi:hypothetical protein